MSGPEAEAHLRRTFLGKHFQLNPSFTCGRPAKPEATLCKVRITYIVPKSSNLLVKAMVVSVG